MMMLVLHLVLFFVSALGEETPNSNFDGKIMGGIDTDILIYPYQVSLQYFGFHSCGASLISPKWVLTAAHCLENTFTSLLSVRAGSTDKDSGGIIVDAKNKYIHPKYDTSTIDYDIGLLELSEPIDIDYAETIPLPPKGVTVKEGDMGTITGWGYTKEDGNLVSELRVTEIPVLNQYQCRRVIGKLITDRMFCAGYVRGGKDACQGDSGGPFIVNGMQMGIVSWGFGCGKPRKPGIYTNIPVVRDYIKSVTGI